MLGCLGCISSDNCKEKTRVLNCFCLKKNYSNGSLVEHSVANKQSNFEINILSSNCDTMKW